jgi:hypothetical protein
MPPATSNMPEDMAAPDQAAAAASQPLTPQRPSMSRSASMPQPSDQGVDSFADDGCVLPLKRRRAISDPVLDNGSSVVRRKRNRVYLTDEDGQFVTDWAADDVEAWRKHTPCKENESEVLCGEDNPVDADTNDAAETAADGDNESLHAQGADVASAASETPTNKKRPAGRAVEKTPLLAMRTCDLTSSFLSAGIHGNSVAQEAPVEEASQTFSDIDDEFGDAEIWELFDSFFP